MTKIDLDSFVFYPAHMPMPRATTLGMLVWYYMVLRFVMRRAELR